MLTAPHSSGSVYNVKLYFVAAQLSFETGTDGTSTTMSSSLELPRPALTQTSSMAGSVSSDVDVIATPDATSGDSDFNQYSRTPTMCDMQDPSKLKLEKTDASPSTSPTLKAVEADAKSEKPRFTQTQKWSLLAMFSLSLFIDSKS